MSLHVNTCKQLQLPKLETIYIAIGSAHFSAIPLSGFCFNLTPENWVGNLNFYIRRKQKSRKSLIIFGFRIVQAFRLLASLKGKSQNRFLAFGFLASPCAVSRIHPLVARSPPFCTCAILPMTTLLRDQEWSQSRRFNWSTTKTLLWSPSATSR